MPKGVYERTTENTKQPRTYPPEVVEAVRRMYLDDGMTVREVQAKLPKGYKAQRIIERHVEARRAAVKRDQVGEANSTWRGSDVLYGSAHARLNRERGKACTHPCADCPRMAADWSYEGGCPDEQVGTHNGCRYCTHPEHYRPRCRSCHRVHDQRGGRDR